MAVAESTFKSDDQAKKVNFAVESKRFTRFTHANTKRERDRDRGRER